MTFQALAVAMAIALVTAFPASAKIIGPDRGGKLAEYLRERAELEASGEGVVIDRYCASACLVYTSLPNACVTSRTKFLLHPQRNPSHFGAALYAARLPEGMSEFWVKRFAGNTNLKAAYRIGAQDAVRRGWNIQLCEEYSATALPATAPER